MDRYDEASLSFVEGAALAEQTGNKRQSATLWLNLAELDCRVGDYVSCSKHVACGYAFAMEAHSQDDIAYAQSIRGAAFLAQGRPKEAEAELLLAISKSEQIGALWNLSEMYANLALARLALGDHRAHDDAAQSMELVYSSSPGELGLVLNALSQVEMNEGALGLAEEHLRSALASYGSGGNELLKAKAAVNLARFLIRSGMREEAVGLLNEAHTVVQRLRINSVAMEISDLLQKSAT
jgi:tetratricopeptide (TPR) repeat protein